MTVLDPYKTVLNPSNILTFIGFCIAAFAFLSQYLSFPKDILSELMRTLRPNPGELPLFSEQDCTENSNTCEKQANDHIKTFFLEHDTVTFVTLLHLVYSILISLLLLIYLEYFINSCNIITYIILGFSFIYWFFVVYNLVKARKDDSNLSVLKCSLNIE